MNSAMDDDSLPLTTSVDSDDPYNQLPECLQQYYTREQYMWLSDAEKGRLEQTETEPEW
jgi:hypothetical protein